MLIATVCRRYSVAVALLVSSFPSMNSGQALLGYVPPHLSSPTPSRRFALRVPQDKAPQGRQGRGNIRGRSGANQSAKFRVHSSKGIRLGRTGSVSGIGVICGHYYL